jgi:hypothetical protein
MPGDCHIYELASPRRQWHPTATRNIAAASIAAGTCGRQSSEVVRNRMLVSLRGGGGELGNLKPYPMASLNLHKSKLEHTI